MSEKIQEQISAFLDGELPANEAEMLVHRLGRDPAMHRKALNYRAIGAAMRGESLYPDPNQLRHRILRTLDGEPPAVQSAPASGWRQQRLTRPLIGVAVAATVAVVGIASLQNVAQQGGNDTTAELVAESSPGSAPSYVVPQDAADARLVQGVPIRLTNYLVNHGEYATGLGRKSIQSGIVGYRSNVDSDEDGADRASR